MSASAPRWTLYFDGGCDQNPGGRATYGWVLTSPDGAERKGADVVGTGEGMTNNVAEWSGLVAGLRAARDAGAGRLLVRGDSELVIRQLQGRYKVKARELRRFYDLAIALLDGIDAEYEHIPRDANEQADALARSV